MIFECSIEKLYSILWQSKSFSATFMSKRRPCSFRNLTLHRFIDSSIWFIWHMSGLDLNNSFTEYKVLCQSSCAFWSGTLSNRATADLIPILKLFEFLESSIWSIWYQYISTPSIGSNDLKVLCHSSLDIEILFSAMLSSRTKACLIRISRFFNFLDTSICLLWHKLASAVPIQST